MKITNVYEPTKDNPSNWIEIGDDKHEVIAEIKGTHYDIPWEDTQRYAHLFCAAEDLLEACEDALHHHFEFGGGLHMATVLKLKEAIEKAKG